MPAHRPPTLESLAQATCSVEERIQVMQRLVDRAKAKGWPTDVAEETVRSLVELLAIYQAILATVFRQQARQAP